MARVCAAAILLLTVGRAAVAQTTRAAVDPDSPTAAVQSWLLALDGVHPESVPDLLLATTPQEQEVSAAMAELAAATGKLRGAAIEQFGNKATRLLGNQAGRIAGMSERVTGDRAVVTFDGSIALNLVRADGRWRIPVAQVTQGVTARDLSARVAKIHLMAASVMRIAEDVANDRFHTADEVAQAMQEEVIRAAVRQNQPTTTTAPTTGPATRATDQ